MSNPMEELRRAREAAGLSLEDVERKIHVQSRYLKAIEEGDFSALPGYSYTRAIIRSYAQCLGVSSAPILHYYEEQSQSYTTEVLTPARRPLPSRRDRYAARKSRSKDRKPPFRGRALGPAYRDGMLKPRTALSTEQVFLAGQPAEIALVPEPSRPLAISVTTADGKSICSRVANAPRTKCSWMPVFTSRVQIRIVNEGEAPARYYLVSN